MEKDVYSEGKSDKMLMTCIGREKEPGGFQALSVTQYAFSETGKTWEGKAWSVATVGWRAKAPFLEILNLVCL